MDYISHELSTGALARVKVIEDITIYHRLFAKDIGIFIPMDEDSYKKLQDILQLYEAASGAKMNLRKTVIIPLSMEVIPQWIHNTGKKISGPREV